MEKDFRFKGEAMKTLRELLIELGIFEKDIRKIIDLIKKKFIDKAEYDRMEKAFMSMSLANETLAETTIPKAEVLKIIDEVLDEFFVPGAKAKIMVELKKRISK